MRFTLLPVLAALLPAAPDAVVLLDTSAASRFELRTSPPGAGLLETAGGALRVRVETPGPRAEAIRVAAAAEGPVRAGDLLLAEFTLRAAGSERVEVIVRFEPGDTPWSRPLDMPAEAGREAARFQFPFYVRRDYEKGELSFLVGSRRQSLEITAVRLSNYRNTARIEELPTTRLSYEGAEPSAAWRSAARDRIERIRKSGLTVRVRDENGKPVNGASVSVRMRRHAFGFGACINAPLLVGRARGVFQNEARQYREAVVELFNKAVMENALKWPQWADEKQRPVAIQAVDWLSENGLPVRGHVLVWPSWRWTPVPEAVRVRNDPPSLAKVIRDHVLEAAGAMRGRLVEWDVVNEPYSNHDFMDILGRQVMADWFKAAREADPRAKLYINDYDILAGNDTRHQDHYFETIQYLIAQGAPVEGIGLQGHFGPRVTPPEEVLRRLDRFAQFGKALQITEFDVDTNDEQTQADYTRDFLTAVFSHPAATGFLMWGFWEGSHWKPKCAMYRKDWSEKPNLRSYRDLVFNQWWSNADGTTASDGTYATRGFHGEYLVEVRANGRLKRLPATLLPGGATVDVTLKGD